MIEIKAYGEVKNGCFYPRQPQVYLQAIKEAGNVSHCLLTLQGSNKRTVDQNAYMWAMCECIRVALATYGWVEFEADDVYRRIEGRYCKTTTINKQTGETTEYIKPLKKMDRERFSEIQEKARIDYMQKLDIYIQTPPEFYGLTDDAYELWKTNVISFAQAKKQSQQVN